MPTPGGDQGDPRGSARMCRPQPRPSPCSRATGQGAVRLHRLTASLLNILPPGRRILRCSRQRPLRLWNCRPLQRVAHEPANGALPPLRPRGSGSPCRESRGADPRLDHLKPAQEGGTCGDQSSPHHLCTPGALPQQERKALGENHRSISQRKRRTGAYRRQRGKKEQK